VTTKIMALADALGNLVDFRLLPGQAHDLRGTAALIEGLSCQKLLADRGLCLESGGNSPEPSSERFDLRLIRRRGQVSLARSFCRGFAIRRACAW